MNQAQPAKEWGLLANGCAGRWSVDIDESHDGSQFNMQLDGPHVYLGFALENLEVISRLHSYLRAGLQRAPSDSQSGPGQTGNGLVIGRLGSMCVSIIQDDESATRWFVIMDGGMDAVVRLTLDATDVGMLVEALQQVMDDLAQ